MHVTQFSSKWGLALYCTDPFNYFFSSHLGPAHPQPAMAVLPRSAGPGVRDPLCPGAQPLLHQHLPQLGEGTPSEVTPGICSLCIYMYYRFSSVLRIVDVPSFNPFCPRTPRRAVVAEGLRPLTYMYILEVPGSNPSPAVAPLGKALYPHCLVFRRRLLSRRSRV